MKTSDLLKCALPIICEHDDPEYPYWQPPGTCFAVSYLNRLFIITAWHVLKNNNIDPNNLRIPYHQASSLFLPIVWKAIPSKYDALDSDYADIAIFTVDQSLLDEQAASKCYFLDLNIIIPINQYQDSCLIVRGYPGCLSMIDYDTKPIITKGFSVKARYTGNSPSQYCRQLKFYSLDKVDDVNGLSGAPVFHFRQSVRNKYEPEFAGMMIRATKESMLGHFIDSSVIHKALSSL